MENETFLEEFKRYIANPKSRLFLILGVAVISVASILLVFVVINNHNTSREFDEAKKIEENPAKKADILSQIIKNNPKSSVNPSLGVSGNEEVEADPVQQEPFRGRSGYTPIDPSTGLLIGIGGAGQNLMAVGPNEQPDLTKYNYRKTTETITPGVISNVCNYTYSYLSQSRYVTSEFFDENNSYYSRNTQYEDGSLKGYVTSRYGLNVNETYSYSGGAYAVKQKYRSYWNESSQRPTSYPIPTYSRVSVPVSYAEISTLVQNYFGGNAVIQRVYQEANRTFYEIQSSYKYNCDTDLPENVSQYIDENGLVPFITVTTVDATNFEITKTKTYISSISPDNLVFVRDYKVEYLLTNYNNVSDEFGDKPVEDVRNIDWSDYVFSPTEYANRTSDYMKNNGFEILLPSDDVDINYLSAKGTPSVKTDGDYYRDRNFYTPGEKGDATYAELMEQFGPMNPRMYYGTTTKNGYYTYSFSQYEADADKELLKKNFSRYLPNNATQFTRQLNINNELIDVNLIQSIYSIYPNYYSYQTSYPVSFVESLASKYPTYSEASYPVSFPGRDYYWVYYRFYFEYQGFAYIGDLNGWAIDRFLSEPFNSLDLNNPNEFYQYSLAAWKGYYGGYGYYSGLGYY